MGKKIIVEPHYCSKEEWQELKEYLEDKAWDWKEVKEDELPEGHHIAEILFHDIEWWAEGFEEDKLPDTDEEHIIYMIQQGFREGELNIGQEEYRGWWQIQKK